MERETKRHLYSFEGQYIPFKYIRLWIMFNEGIYVKKLGENEWFHFPIFFLNGEKSSPMTCQKNDIILKGISPSLNQS